MADTVRHFMEEMVPELEDLEDKGYLTIAEIRGIVKKRENFEYALKRRNPTKADYLRYIEFEASLDELIRLRKDSNSIKENIGRGELGCVRRCHLLYDRATKKFKGDLRLWFNWLQFCKASSSTRQMSKVVTKALQLHPKEPELWTFAAAWEFEHSNNTSAARSLMQQGLRFNHQSEQLWAEYLRMELVYAQKLAARQKVLGIRASGDLQDVIIEQEQEAEVKQPSEESKGSLDSIIRGKVAEVVLKNALESIPEKLSLRESLLDVLSQASLPGSCREELVAGIMSDLEEGPFEEDEEAWDLRARRCSEAFASSSGDDASQTVFERASNVYEAALKALPTAHMFDHYAAFLLDQAGWSAAMQETGHSPPHLPKRSHPGKMARKCLALYEMADSQGVLSEESALTWPKLALACGKPSEALEAAESACKLHPQSAALWSQAIALCSHKAGLHQDQGGVAEQAKAVEGLVLRAVECCTSDNIADLWGLCLHTIHSLQLSDSLEPLLQRFLGRISQSGKGPVQGGLGAGAARVLAMLKDLKSIQVCRDFYREVLKLSAAGGSCYHGILDIELNEQGSWRLPDPQIKALFEKAVEAYGQHDTALWLRYVDFEAGRAQGSGNIYWRASKALEQPEKFIAEMSARA